MSEKVSGAALALNRLKHASAAFQEYKSIQLEYESTGVDPDSGVNEGDHMAEGTLTWPEFREQFLKDWNNNRRIVDEKEADVHFDTLADEALNELDNGTAVVATADVEIVKTEASTASVEDSSEDVSLIPSAIAAPKRRGRPPGSGKKAASIVKTPTVKAKRGRPAGTKNVKIKAQAAKKKSGTATSKGQSIVEKYGPSGRKWQRKDVIEKLIASGISAGYAPSVYQKYA